MTVFLIAAGVVAIGWALRDIQSKAQRIREPLWLDDDTDGLTVD